MAADDDAPGGKEPPQEAPGTPFGTPAKSKTSRAPETPEVPKKKPASSPGSLKLKRPAAAVPPVATPKKAAAKVKAKAKAKSSSAKGKGKVAGLKRPAAKAEEEPEAKKKKEGSRKVDTEWCKGLAKTEREHQGEKEEQEKGEEEETEDPSVDPGDAFAVASAEDEGTKNRSKHAKVPQAVERQPPATVVGVGMEQGEGHGSRTSPARARVSEQRS